MTIAAVISAMEVTPRKVGITHPIQTNVNSVRDPAKMAGLFDI
jgi:hypothetical protein